MGARFLGGVLCVWFCLIANIALGADAAYPQAVGFSADGDRFAFGEWGQQDGSGFAYASIYFMSLADNSWLASPVRVTIKDETALPRAAWDKALAQATRVLAKHKIGLPARLVYARPFLGGSSKGDEQVAARWQAYSLPNDPPKGADLKLEAIEFESKDCTDPVVGFALMENGEATYRDERLPKSRGCPVGYSIERVYVADHVFPDAPAVAIIGVHRWGFEGQDRRHIAVPLAME